MINLNPPPPSDPLDLLDWQSLNPTRTELLPEHLQQAAHLSQSIRLPDQRWQVYLCALGLLGFQEWLSDRAPELTVQSDRSSIWQPAYANLLGAVCNIRVGSFKLCLVTPGSYIDRDVNLPNAVFDVPDFAAHFYVLLQVVEEEQQVAVSGFLSYEQYRQHQASLQADSDWMYTLPKRWFNPDPNALLLNLRCLDESAIHLPKTASVPRSAIASLQQKLTTLQPQLQTQPLWNFLTPEEGATLLGNANLVNWVYEASEIPVSPPPRLPTINVGRWFQDQLDAVAEELGWLLMPSPALPGMRSQRSLRSREEFDSVRSSLEQKGVHIPPEAKGAYRDLRWDGGSLRLYAVTWLMESEQLEWMLLVALSMQSQVQTSSSIELEVREETKQLFKQTLTENLDSAVLYAQVIGNWGDQFWVTVTADEEAVFELPPFSFEIEDENNS